MRHVRTSYGKTYISQPFVGTLHSCFLQSEGFRVHFCADDGKWEKYLALFQKYGVDVVFAGHTHMDYDTTAEGIRFVTAGPVGMPLGRGYSGYEVVTVTKDGVDCRFVKTP
ncbi:MAG: metallophosphoesterase family protein [Bacteroidales bacterium]|nr:metallophosphoesterase family protein [Bacteroidales bacterium]MBR2134649.1 metallophosphoesterase family protein [Bacteroidales bacterium]